MRNFGVGAVHIVALLLSVTACSPSFGRFTETAYRSDEYPIAVRYAGGSPATILGKDWIVENFRYVDGSPDGEKNGPRYVVSREYDTEGNGRFATVVDELRWALRLEHKKEDAVIWLSAMPLSEKDRDKDLSVLAQRLLDDMSGSETVATLDRATWATLSLSVSERRAAVRSLDSSPCSVSGREAWSVDADVANVDALSLSQTSLSRRMRLVVIRTGFSHHPKGSTDFPVFLLAGYSNAPAAFAGRLGDFNEFLSLLTLGDGSTNAPHTCTASPPAAYTQSPGPHVPPPPEPPAPTEAPPS